MVPVVFTCDRVAHARASSRARFGFSKHQHSRGYGSSWIVEFGVGFAKVKGGSGIFQHGIKVER